MWPKLVAWWNGLPHPIQAVVMLFAAGFFGVLEKAVQDWAQGVSVCPGTASACVTAYLINAVKAGIIGVGGLYVKSSLYHQAPADPPTQK